MTDVLHDFARESFEADGKTRDIYRLGTGPAVIVISEVPGITPLSSPSRARWRHRTALPSSHTCSAHLVRRRACRMR